MPTYSPEYREIDIFRAIHGYLNIILVIESTEVACHYPMIEYTIQETICDIDVN